MHTTTFSEKDCDWDDPHGGDVVVNHNGDYSGDMLFVLDPQHVERCVGDERPPQCVVHIPSNVIRALVARQVVGRRISVLEQATVASVLGLPEAADV